MTAFEGECRSIIELYEHLKLCFHVIVLFVLLKGVLNGLLPSGALHSRGAMDTRFSG